MKEKRKYVNILWYKFVQLAWMNCFKNDPWENAPTLKQLHTPVNFKTYFFDVIGAKSKTVYQIF